MNIEKWVHVTELGGDPWALPIIAAIHDAEKRQKIKPLEEDFYELPWSISIKLNMIPRIITRINEERFSLLKEVEAKLKPEYIFADGCTGRTINVEDNLKYKLLCDISSFFFEVNSCAELIKEFTFRLLNSSGKEIEEKDVINYIKNIIKERGEDIKWFKDLDKSRNFFLHKGAPYVAVDVSDPECSEIFVIKRNRQEFRDKNSYIPIDTFRRIAVGFKEAKIIIQAHLIDYLEKL